MANRYRGEVALELDGRPHLLRLPLGVLVELEGALACGSLLALVERFENGSFSAADLLALLQAGLRGGGSDADLEKATIGGGVAGAARAAAQLLHVTFSVPE